MVSAIQTSTLHSASSGLLKLRSPALTASQAASTSRLAGPIKLSGQFEKHGIKCYDVTPAIGTEFPDGAIDLGELLSRDDDETRTLVRELASMVAHRGVVFVRNQKNLTAEQMTILANKMGELSGRPRDSKLHIHPLTSDFSESGEYIGKGEKIDSEPDAQGRQISFPDEKSNFASAGWHTDISFEPIPSDYAMLRLTTIPPVGGDTMWASMYSAYDALSPAMQRFLEGLTATHDAEMFRTQSQRYGFDLYSKPRGHPENVGTHLRTSHPVIRTNPVTGWKGLYVNKSFTRRINELSVDESDALLAYLFRHIAENFNFHVRFRWAENDLCIWDNRTTNHSGIFDFGKQKRTGDRCCSLGEKPYLDPHSRSRKEELGI